MLACQGEKLLLLRKKRLEIYAEYVRICYVSKKGRNFSVFMSDELIEKLELFAKKMNEQAGAKIWSRNKLIVKAAHDFYFTEISIPEERRRINIPVDKDRRINKDRRKMVLLTCAMMVRTPLEPKLFL